MSTDADFREELEARTAAYLGRMDDCVALLSWALDEYGDGGSYREAVDEIAAVENECDDLVRELTALITRAGPDDIGLLNTRINFNESALLNFYNDTDVVANRTERIVQEVAMMCPDGDATETLAEEIELISDLESECDELRNDAIETAIADDAIDQPPVYRELAILLDELANTVEDLTDSRVVIASKEPGIVTNAGGK